MVEGGEPVRPMGWCLTPARREALIAGARLEAGRAADLRVRVLAASRREVPVAEIASLLGVTTRTVERHRARLRAEGRL